MIYGEKPLLEFIHDVQGTLSGIDCPHYAYVDPVYQQEVMDFLKLGIKMKVPKSRIHRHPTNESEGYGHCSASYTPGRGFVAPLGGYGPPKSIDGSFCQEDTSVVAIHVAQIDLEEYGIEDAPRRQFTRASARSEPHATKPALTQETTRRFFRSSSSASSSSQKTARAPTLQHPTSTRSSSSKSTRAAAQRTPSNAPSQMLPGATARPYTPSVGNMYRKHQPKYPIINPALKRVEQDLKVESTLKARILPRNSPAEPEKGHIGSATKIRLEGKAGVIAPAGKPGVNAEAKLNSPRVDEKAVTSKSTKNTTKNIQNIDMADTSKDTGHDDSSIVIEVSIRSGNQITNKRTQSKQTFTLPKEARAINRKLRKASQELNDKPRNQIKTPTARVEEQETIIINPQSSQDSTYGSQEDPKHHTLNEAFSDNEEVDAPTIYSSANKPREFLNPVAPRRSTRISKRESPAPSTSASSSSTTMSTPSPTTTASPTILALGKRVRKPKTGSPAPTKCAKTRGSPS